MTADVDDEALTWQGDSDPSHVAAPASEPKKPKDAAPAPAAKPAPVPNPATGPETARPATGSFLLVSYGILAGTYLIFTLGWIATIVANPATPNADVLGQFMFRVTQGLAIASPAIWYGASFVLIRGRRPILRLLALLVGLAVVLPWPFLLIGA